MKRKNIAINTALLAVTVTLALLISEAGARLVLRPSDYLSVEMVEDDVLGAKPSLRTKAGGLDGWGFRNREVPKHAEIVAIGDSQTYGNAATMDDAWPAVLERESGRRVYNMGLGGYGPNQYLQLLKDRALALKPKIIVLGFSMNDDFENAFLITYGLDYWKSLRVLAPEKVHYDIWEQPTNISWHKSIRLWLSRHSVVYQVVVHGPVLFGRLQGETQIARASALYNGTTLAIPERHILEAFRPQEVLRRLDQQSPDIREGMRIALKLLGDMNKICVDRHVQFVVAVIPTKEMVFSDYFESHKDIPLSDVLQRLVANERVAREKMFGFLRTSNITYVDLLPPMKNGVEKEIYTRTATDMHPNKNGYRIYAEAVYEALKRNDATRTILESAAGTR